jgi:cation-transporting P-type ATPase 13A2
MVVATLVSTYMLFDPAKWLSNLMELTYMSWDFKVFLLILGFAGFAIAMLCEKYAFAQLARQIGKTKAKLFPKKQKQRKQYKVIEEGLRL